MCWCEKLLEDRATPFYCRVRVECVPRLSSSSYTILQQATVVWSLDLREVKMATQGIVQNSSTNGPTPPFSTHTSFLSNEALPITVEASPSTKEGDKVNTGGTQSTALVLVAKVLANLSQETLARACLAVNPERFISPAEPTQLILTAEAIKSEVKAEQKDDEQPRQTPYMNGIESLINAANNNSGQDQEGSSNTLLPDGECDDAESQSLSQSHSSFASHYSTSSAGSGTEAAVSPQSLLV